MSRAKKTGKKTNTKAVKTDRALIKFVTKIQSGYVHKGENIQLGAGMLGDKTLAQAKISLPLKTLNRHGLIAGATGTGKTKSLQLIAGELSALGVPSLLMDLKGDLSGLAAEGVANKAINARHELLDLPFVPRAYPTEFLSLSKEKGLRLRATIAEFGPLLLAKILDLNETQSGILAVIFKFCDDEGLLLLDLPDLKKTLHFVTNEGKKLFQEQYGRVSPASISTILRKIVALEQQGAEKFFGERSFEVNDLMRFDESGRGIISIIRLLDIQNKPALFSTFMLQLLAEIYETFPEQGDTDRPGLVIFIDEAHLVFKGAKQALLDQLEMIVKLIRSKGVGLIFCTQNPEDIPGPVLSQLGMKVQHALRAFTAKDRKAIKKASENFPDSEFYETETLLTEMGIGEALVTLLGEKGKPTPLARTMLRAPASRMGTLKAAEIKKILDNSGLAEKYSKKLNRESAYEVLSKKAESMAAENETAGQGKGRGRKKKEQSKLEKILDSTLARQIGRTVARELTRGILGVFGIKSRRRRRRKSWF